MKEEDEIWANFNNKVFGKATLQQKIVQLKRLVVHTWQQHESEIKSTDNVLKVLKLQVDRKTDSKKISSTNIELKNTKNWKQWRFDFDYLTFQNSQNKKQVLLARYKGKWTYNTVDGTNRPIDHIEDLTKAQAIKKANIFMQENE